MEQLEQPVKPKPKRSIMKIIGAVVLVFLLITASLTVIFWQKITEQAKYHAQMALTEQIKNYLGREVSFENVSFTQAGQVGLTGVSVYSSGAVLAKIPVVRVYYNWQWEDFNFENFNFKDLAYIERIFLQRCEIFIREENNRMDFGPIFQAQDGGWDNFKGQVHFGAAKINLLHPARGQGMVVEEINGEIDFKNPENVAIDLTGNFEKTPVNVKGAYLRKSGEFSVTNALAFNLTNFDLGRISEKLADVKVKEGVLGKLSINAKKNAANIWEFAAEGDFSGLALDMPAAVYDGQGRFTADNSKIIFEDISFKHAGQHAQGKGSILWQSALEQSDIDFTFILPLLDSAIISPRLKGEQPISVEIFVAGIFEKPAVSGKFSVSRLNLGSLPVSNIVGNFSYAGNHRAILNDIKGESLGGIITAFGDLYLDNYSCELNISGEKMDGFLLLGKDIRGELDFSGHMSSRDKTVIAKGNFIIKNGSAFGTAFQVFNGFFIRQDDKSDVSDIAIRTDNGSIYPAMLSKEAMDAYLSEKKEAANVSENKEKETSAASGDEKNETLNIAENRGEDKSNVSESRRDDRSNVSETRREDRLNVSEARRDDRLNVSEARRDDRLNVSEAKRDDRLNVSEAKRDDRVNVSENKIEEAINVLANVEKEVSTVPESRSEDALKALVNGEDEQDE